MIMNSGMVERVPARCGDLLGVGGSALTRLGCQVTRSGVFVTPSQYLELFVPKMFTRMLASLTLLCMLPIP